MAYFNMEGALALRILPATLDANNKISGFGTLKDFVAIQSPSFEKVNPEAIEYYEERLSGGKTMRSPKLTAYYDGITGVKVGKDGDTFDLTVVCMYADIKWLIALLEAEPQVPLFLGYAPLLDEGGVPEGWVHHMCKIDGNIKYTGGDGIAKIPIKLKGISAALTDTTPPAYTAYNTAMCTTKVQPFGWEVADALTIPGLASSGDFDDLRSGVLVIKDVP